MASPLMTRPIPIPMSPPPMMSKPSMSRHRSRPSHADSGYSTSPEGSSASTSSSSSSSRRSAPQTPRSSLAQPLKSILKTGTTESSVVIKASLVRQDHDGYASSPEKPRASHGSRSQLSRSRLANSAMDSSTPPATLHWKLLPFDAKRARGLLRFDFSRDVDAITLAEPRRPGRGRPLTVDERNKSAADPGLTEMVIFCAELPDWPVHVARLSGIRCVDVFEAIRDTYNVVLTSTERKLHAHAVHAAERRKPPSPEKKGVRRSDLLDGHTIFLGLDWRASDARYPDGCWCLKVGPAS
ncbi:hypothetical protein BC834DRAFT_971031 [Gloeopeniophorella convolvens]|nr:hypothetical protein BC834DRAFT_971031 [Gloeopeniophorella convolvens]